MHINIRINCMQEKNHSDKKINFFITSDTFPSISVTGNSCSLMCQHCSGKLLQRLIHATTNEELEKKALTLYRSGAKGILLTGGCDKQGRVPIKSLIPAIKKLKETTDLILIAHTGFISGEEAGSLKDSGLDGIGFDVMGDMTSVLAVYGLHVSEKEYMDSLHAISDSGLLIFPHVCVGIHFGKLGGEYRALEMIRSKVATTVIITGLMPVVGTPMEHIKPDPLDFEKIIKKAIAMFPDIPVVLGCAHSSGKDRADIEKIALLCGVSGIAAPTFETIRFAKESNYKINYYGTCCGLIPDDKMKINYPLLPTLKRAW
ncbi:Biotin synthase [uncultured archaeon]|nr:Biotin synthase [uncultured archaeon]